MCIAILLPAFKEIDKKTLKICNSTNPDGFGFAYFADRLIIKKEVDKNRMDAAMDKFIKIRKKFIDKPFLVHFRIATHGVVSYRCCHPFKINKNAVFCHNGILRYDYGVDRNSLDSDTMMFNKNILQKIEKNCLNEFIKGNSKVLKDLLEGYIGTGNKMIFLNKDGNFTILNERLGIWDNGVWYSNDSYKDKIIVFPKYNYNYYENDWYGQYWDNDEGCWKNYTSKKWYKGIK